MTDSTKSQHGLITKAVTDNKVILPKKEDGLEPRQWKFAELQGFTWNRLFPYQFLIVERVESGWVQADIKDSRVRELGPYTLPISPEQLQISTPFAISTTATLNGIVEEHNGIVFRNISIRGSTGILPLKSSATPTNLISGQNALGGIFAGTINAINNTASLFKGVEYPNVIPQAQFETDDHLIRGTGYFQWKLLERWFEAYSELKRKKNAARFAMALAVHKESAIYICTPVSFDLQRSAQSPLEYMYSVNLRCWGRITSSATSKDAYSAHNPGAQTPGLLSKVLNKVAVARQVLEGAKNTLTAFRGDVQQAVLDPMKEVALFCKDGLGVAESASDLPVNIINDLREPLLEFGSLKNAAEEAGVKFDTFAVRVQKAFDSLSLQSGKVERDSSRAGSSKDALGSDPLNSPHPANNNELQESHTLLDAIKPGNLPLKSPIRRKITEEKNRVRNLRREDFEVRRDKIQNFLDNFQASLGLLPSNVSEIYGIPPQSKVREPTDSDYEIIYALSATVQQLDQIVATSAINRDTVDTMDYFAGLANRSGIAFSVPQSKILVPLPYGVTLEKLSETYFGTPERWHEIAALNGLQSPYIDEIGFKQALLTNGLLNTVTVSDATRLYVNQPVWISSAITARTKRRITKISKLTEGQYILTLTGDSDLGQYTTAAGAYLQGFLPNTINSQQSLYIPSSEPTSDIDFRQKSIPGIDQFDPLVRIGGIDLLLDSKNDLIFTPDGDCRLAVGLVNIIQKIRILVGTPLGTLMDHPEYGFPVQPGQSQADLSAQEILRICKDLFKDDPSFAGVESANVVKDGPTVSVSLFIALQGVSQSIPVTINIVR